MGAGCAGGHISMFRLDWPDPTRSETNAAFAEAELAAEKVVFAD
jgi:hypothetical protein